jgi:RNA polymerase sigma-70 factor (ECF subfamily)
MAVSTEKIWEEFGASLKQFIIKRVQNEHDAEDIRQEVFRKFHTNIDKTI